MLSDEELAKLVPHAYAALSASSLTGITALIDEKVTAAADGLLRARDSEEIEANVWLFEMSMYSIASAMRSKFEGEASLESFYPMARYLVDLEIKHRQNLTSRKAPR